MPQWPDILTLKEASQYLRVDERTLLNEINAGRIPAKKFGNDWRIHKESLDKLFESNAPTPHATDTTAPQANKAKKKPPQVDAKKTPTVPYDQSKVFYADAIVARQKRQFDDARRLFEKAIKNNPTLNIFQTYAAMESSLKNYQHAKEIYERGLEINPKWGQLYVDYAMFIRKSFGNLELALTILQRGLENAKTIIAC